MVIEESPPAVVRVASAMHPAEVARDGPFCDLEAELQNLAVDLGSAPTGILVRQAADQMSQLRRDVGSPTTPTRAPAPIPTKPRSLPGHNSIWLHDDEHVLPTRPESPQRDPEQPIVHLHRRSRPLPLKHTQLL